MLLDFIHGKSGDKVLAENEDKAPSILRELAAALAQLHQALCHELQHKQPEHMEALNMFLYFGHWVVEFYFLYVAFFFCIMVSHGLDSHSRTRSQGRLARGENHAPVALEMQLVKDQNLSTDISSWGFHGACGGAKVTFVPDIRRGLITSSSCCLPRHSSPLLQRLCNTGDLLRGEEIADHF